MICLHLAKFGGHRYCSSREKMFLVCHVIKPDQVIKGSGDYNDRSPSRVTTQPGLLVKSTVVVKI